MSNTKSFSCFVIGGDTLLTECAELLLERGHHISGVITAAAKVRNWAESKGLRVVDARQSYHAALTDAEFDYLFAITHLALIPDEVLKLPRRGAINFHDGPLPRYAGLNAPAWALLEQESSYGISWHVITPGVDEGDLLEQRTFELTPEETSLSLNTRCFAAGLESFGDLVDKLSRGTEERTPQDLSERSVFTRNQRPPAAVVDWHRPAEELAAVVRALDFGPYPNLLATPKVRVGGQLYLLREAQSDDSDVPGQPGEIVSLDAEHVGVCTGEGILRGTSLATLSGLPVSPREFARTGGVSEGHFFDVLSQEERTALNGLIDETAPAERFWRNRLEHLEPMELPARATTQDSARTTVHDLAIPAGYLTAADPENRIAGLLTGFAAWLARTGGKSSFSLGYAPEALAKSLGTWTSAFATEVPMQVDLKLDAPFASARDAMVSELQTLARKRTFLRDLVARFPELSQRKELQAGLLPISVRVGGTEDPRPAPGAKLTLALNLSGDRARLIFDEGSVDPDDQRRILEQLTTFLENLSKAPDSPLQTVSLLSPSEREQVLETWNRTAKEHDRTLCLHELFEAQVRRTPEADAISFEGASLSYRELNARANQLARYLTLRGVGPEVLVGVYLERSLDLVIAIYAVHKAGGAYLPLDPSFPPDRIGYMLEDAKAPVVLTEAALAPRLPRSRGAAEVIKVDGVRAELAGLSPENLDIQSVRSSNLAYVIYTSGSTGRPKGVLVEHRHVHNFFVGMDDRVPIQTERGTQPCWLAVTSLSFDISVLELFWTLCRGFKVVIYRDRERADDAQEIPAHVAARPMGFGLFMWGNDDGPGKKKYQLMIEGAKFLDQNGFNSVWTPERHFHAFGGPYPNPSVTGAALAMVTENVQIRSGSCVSPLHHPVRIAEEWAVVDNLSNGRVGLSFASGWQPNDFILRPENYGTREKPKAKQVMLEQIETVRRLWRGEKVAFPNPFGDMVEVQTLPRPVQPELPFWVTTAGNPKTYADAGRSGANVLTHLLGQSFEEVAGKIEIYRKARAEAGHDPKAGIVTLMLHTLLSESRQKARELAHQPLKDYLGSSVALVKGFAWTFPAFKRPEGEGATPMDIDLGSLSEEELDAILEFAFDRYFETSGLFGTPDEAIDIINKAKTIDVDEIACLLDFGAPTDQVMAGLPLIAEVVRRANARVGTVTSEGTVKDLSIAAQIESEGVTHLQCTPSMARMMLLSDRARGALGRVEHMMVGGEAFPSDLARELKKRVRGTVTNMYGPTETTIWSSTHRLDNVGDIIPIGTPIANTALYVLDHSLEPVPVGTPGELWIGGEGVVRGYHDRPELTRERFVDDPFSHLGAGARMYRTGDLVRWRTDGVLEFIGRVDHQVKIRGYRIELGEIEARLAEQPGIRECVVIVREDTPGDQRLVAYLVVSAGSPVPETSALKGSLRASLPEYMVPATFAVLDAMPLTPNAKIDRKALPAPDELAAQAAQVAYVEPQNDTEHRIAEIWQQTLGKERVGVDDNFFDIGGHSLLVVRMHRTLREAFDQPIALTDLYRFPTIRSFTQHLSGDAEGLAAEAGSERGRRRKEMAARRRRR